MPLDDQQKKQALILFFLVLVLGAVFYFLDPFKLFVKNSAISPETNKKIAAQIQKTKEAQKAGNTVTATDPKNPNDPKNAVTKPVENIDINTTTTNYDELIPEAEIYEAVKQFDTKTSYKPDVFIIKGGFGTGVKDPGPPLESESYSNIGNVKQVKFKNVVSVNSNEWLKKGDEFYFQNKRYRILNITIGYDSETKSQGVVKILDITEGADTYNRDYPIYLK